MHSNNIIHSPTGLVSKNSIGARRIALNILLCKFLEALRQIKLDNIALHTVNIMVAITIIPNIPILWLVVRSEFEEPLLSKVTFSSLGEQDPPSLALRENAKTNH